ncbi:hypothetical protein PG984_012312 [Apiospora sp. TS-2023a]
MPLPALPGDTFTKGDKHRIDVPNLQSDAELKAHFKTIPKDCFVLLKDIDCVGLIKRAVVKEAAEVAKPGQPLERGGGG